MRRGVPRWPVRHPGGGSDRTERPFLRAAAAAIPAADAAFAPLQPPPPITAPRSPGSSASPPSLASPVSPAVAALNEATAEMLRVTIAPAGDVEA